MVTGVTCTQLEHTQLGHILAKNSSAKINAEQSEENFREAAIIPKQKSLRNKGKQANVGKEREIEPHA